MRPAGEVRQALLRAAHDFREQGQAATLADLAQRSCVGREVARRYVDNLRRAGQLQIVGVRTVSYRNRPVAEYAVPPATDASAGDGWANLGACLHGWAR